MMSEWVKRRVHWLEQAEGYRMPESADLEQDVAAPPEVIKLDANENFFLPSELLRTWAREVADRLDPRFYSTVEYHRVVRALSDRVGLSPAHIVLGNGGDQIIDLVARTFLDATAKAVSISPTYSFYRLRARLTGAAWTEVPLREDFSLDVDRLLDVGREAQMIFLCSPNNPTGNQFDPEQLRSILRRFDGLVFIDEAYAEFAGETRARWVTEFRHLIIMRTFSKLHGLAGLRLGYMLADPIIARPFAEKMQYPYSVSTFTLHMALKLLEHDEHVRTAVEQMRSERARLQRELNAIEGIRAFDSCTNFILFQVNRPVESVHQQLIERGLFLKKIGDVMSYQNCLRTTVGPREVNDRLIIALRRICET